MNDKKSLSVARTSDETIDVGKLLAVLWRGKFLIAVCFALSVLAAGYYVYVRATPLYQASAVVLLNSREAQVVDLNSVIGNLNVDSVAVNTEVEILRSLSLLRKVVDKLDLVSDPEFNSALLPVSSLDKLKGSIKQLIGLAEPRQDLSEEDRRVLATERTIKQLLEVLSVRNLPQSLVFRITVETTNPKKSRLIANTLVDLYILNQLEVKFEATEQATNWLADRVTELQIELESAEARVTDFRSQIDLVSDDAVKGLEVQIKEIRDRVQSLKGTRSSDTNLADQVAAATSREEIARLLADTQLTQMLTRIDQPPIQEAFDTRVEQLIVRENQNRQRTESQISALEASLQELEARLERQNADLITLQQLTREAEASRLLYDYFLGRLKETSVQQGIQQADSRSLSSATMPINPTSPRKSVILGSSGILGLLLGMVLVLVREIRHSSFRSDEEVRAYTGAYVLGQIPLIRRRRRTDVLTYLAEKPASAAAEAVRNLRTSILLSNLDKPPQVIMLCSSIPGEGKTTLALALAMNTAAMGQKVLLIEGDMRRHVFSQYLEKGGDQTLGFAGQLETGGDFTKAIQYNERLGCDMMLAGEHKANPADIFSSEKFSDMLTTLRRNYDKIIIDTAPILVVPDGKIIAQHVDLVAYSVLWDKTPRAQVVAGLKEFSGSGRPIDGIVLNRINPKGLRRYGYGGNYGAYADYGSNYYRN